MVVGIAYIWCNEWQEIETLETGNKQINNFRKEINEIQIHLIEFSLLGETVLDWNDDDWNIIISSVWQWTVCCVVSELFTR